MYGQFLTFGTAGFNKFCRKSVEKEFCRRNSQPAKKTDVIESLLPFPT